MLVLIYPGHLLAQKINGLVLASPENPVHAKFLKSFTRYYSNYIELNPVAFSKAGKPMVFFNKPTQYWGERDEGIESMIKAARQNGFEVFLNPKVFIEAVGSPASFNLKDDATWKKWENNYSAYLIHYALIAESNGVALFSIGSDLDNVVAMRKDFWLTLIEDIRKIYSGKLTYAASYSGVNQVPFWKELDYIGINAYYPLSESSTPTIKELISAWQQPKNKLKLLSQTFKKQVIFTEWGYRSIDGCAGNQSKLPNDYIYEGNANTLSQAIAYACLLTVLNNEPWYGGGFCFRFYATEKAGGTNNNDYTPQNKLAGVILKKAYLKNKK